MAAISLTRYSATLLMGNLSSTNNSNPWLSTFCPADLVASKMKYFTLWMRVTWVKTHLIKFSKTFSKKLLMIERKSKPKLNALDLNLPAKVESIPERGIGLGLTAPGTAVDMTVAPIIEKGKDGEMTVKILGAKESYMNYLSAICLTLPTLPISQGNSNNMVNAAFR